MQLRDLVGHNFSHRKIQGAKWKQANLSRANFSKIYAGLPFFWIVILAVELSSLASIAGIPAAFSGFLGTALLTIKNIGEYTIFPGVAVIVPILIGLIVTVKWGFATFLAASAITLCASSALMLVLQPSTLSIIIIYVAFTTMSELLALWLISVAVAAARSIHALMFMLLVILSMATMMGTLVFIKQSNNEVTVDWLDILISTSILLAGGLIGWKTTTPSSRFPGIARLAINLTSIGGTSFWKTNLTEADFSGATLKHTDFQGADLTRTCWRNAKGLEFARLGNTYLANPKIRQLVVTCNGQGKNFDGLDFTGVNLQEADLQDASFIGATLNHSNLRGADFSRAKLKQTQLEGADLTGATLTGAYIEDWGITGTTKLEDVQCEYIYMRVPTQENPNPLRKPDNLRQTFAEGEFADFIQPFFDTLDLYHSQDVDPRAISIALKNLSVNHPKENLQFVAIERRGHDGLNLRFTTTPGADKSELSHEYFANYAQIKKELPVAAQMRLAEQDAEIRTLKGTIEQFIQTGTHRSTVQADTIQVIQGELIVTENRGINIKAGGNIGDVSSLVGGDVSGVINLGTLSGNVTNAINQLPDTLTSDQPNLKDLLIQLQQAIQDDGDLPDPDKADLLEQVQALAEVKQVEELEKKEGLTRKAMKMFDATLKNLPDTAKIVEACGKLLPLILKALGFPA